MYQVEGHKRSLAFCQLPLDSGCSEFVHLWNVQFSLTVKVTKRNGSHARGCLSVV